MIPPRQNIIDWVSQAWESVSTETITKSFLVCGIPNAVNGSEDKLITGEIPRDLEDSDDKAYNEGACEDDGDVDNLDPFFDSDDFL